MKYLREILEEIKKPKIKTLPIFIHFKHVPSAVTAVAEDFKHVSEEKKQLPDINDYLKKDDNLSLTPKTPYKGSEEESTLNARTVTKAVMAKYRGPNKMKISPGEQESIRGYIDKNDSPYREDESPKTWHSYKINSALINNKPIPDHLKQTHDGLSSAITNNPMRVHLHTYSGVSFDPRKHLDENGKMRSPAFMSTTHDKRLAHIFAEKKARSSRPMHIMHIHLKPGDSALPVTGFSEFRDEHETILNKNTVLQHKGTTVHQDPDSGQRVYVHHFEVAR